MSKRRATAVRQTRPLSDRDMVADIAAALVRHERERGKLSAAEATALIKVQESRARLERQANPLAYREVQPEPWPTAPTKEQQAKAKFDRKPEVGGVYSHRVKRAFESLSKHYPDAVLLALTKFYTDAESATICNVTVNYNGSGGGSPNGRLGGLGNVQEHTRLQFARHNRIVEALRGVSEHHIDVLRWLVTEVRKFDSERMPDVTEVGRRLVPSIIDRATSRGISIGYLKAVAELLIHLYRHDRLQYGDEYRRNHDEFEDLEA